MNKYDVVIIGWGKAGKTLAKKLASENKKIAIIEKDPKMFGGTCINVGCLPTKALVHASKIAQQARKFGVKLNWNEKQKYYYEAIKYKKEFVKKLNDKNFNLLDKQDNIDTYVGSASFISKNEIEISSSNHKQVIFGDKIVINTGAKNRKLDHKVEVKSKNAFYSNDILNLTKLPKRLLVIGSGFIGLEFASIYANFGSKVTVYSHNDVFMPSEDASDAAAVKQALQEQGIEFVNNVDVNSIKDYTNDVKVISTIEDKKMQQHFDAVLVAIGRIPNIDSLWLQNAGVQVQNHTIVVDENLKTTTENIWAVGDCKGGEFFTYISLDDSRIVFPQLLEQVNERTRNNRPIIPWSMFIDPIYARVGMNEKQAQQAGIKYSVRSLLTAQIPKAHVINETTGFNKLLLNENDEIIGATLFNYEAAEMINIISLAIVYKIKFSDLKNFIYTHPTFIENLNEF
ncbi:dihydrolipoyl dehydrogenase family protein [Mycoplasma seminis]|uniref:FAD-dependent oxidoreductase n=1 Tax=Mycoplasma seminis TaxID=512749 RepID=A0ABY9HAI0_9MOLU|nr:FAD-dependent oxidoreductase [Mycoplasma seminis]WLP85333.1 FAD-dependent oxidoreductase [Mycoplasma seminis]